VANGQERDWLGRMSWFRTIEGWRAVTELLGDTRMHADILGMFEGLGLQPGPFRDLLSASLLSMNGAEHKRVRAVVASEFTPKSVDRLRPDTRLVAQERIDRFAADGECEFIGAFAVPYVGAATAPFLGIPPGELDEFLPYVRLFGSRDQDHERRLANSSEGMLGLAAYARRLLERRESHPTDDVISTIADAARRGDLREVEAVALVVGVLSAGHDPTINQLGLMIEVMSEHPDLWDAVGTGQVDPTGVIEEVLRYRPTNHQVARCAAQSFEYDGVQFDEGERLVVRLVTASHDPRHFASANEFDPETNRGTHLAFGFGPHYCLGAALARMQLQEGLRVLSNRLHCPRVVASEPIAEGGIVGPASLSIAFRAREDSAVTAEPGEQLGLG
jgi:cytochrome P450